jgi:NlpC/P60 family putative phage cell wall peptidase
MIEVAQDIRGEVVAEARSWLGTPFAHQGKRKGVGIDCLGLVAQTAINCGLVPADSWQTTWAEHAGYASVPANGVLQAVCRRYMRPIELAQARPADVLLISFGAEPHHLAILAPYLHGGLSMIHAYSKAKPPSVVEHRFADVWRALVVEAFALPGVA